MTNLLELYFKYFMYVIVYVNGYDIYVMLIKTNVLTPLVIYGRNYKLK